MDLHFLIQIFVERVRSLTLSRHLTVYRIASIEDTTFGSRVTVAASLCLNPGLLDDRPPFLGIGFHKRAERLRRLLLARENLEPEFN
jgi:hypothetical protein